MKTIYIPAGETACYESLSTEHLIVDGCLRAVYGVRAKTISGSGVISAGTVYADDISIGEIEAAEVVCERAIAKRIDAPEVFASESLAVSCFLSASYVETGKLTVAVSDVAEVKAGQVVHLTNRKRSLLGLLVTSWLRSLWVRVFAPAGESPIMDADFEPLEESGKAKAPVEKEPKEPVDEELNRVVALFKLSREAGYTLRIIPGTPEENAPIFDFAAKTIVRPAA